MEGRGLWPLLLRSLCGLPGPVTLLGLDSPILSVHFSLIWLSNFPEIDLISSVGPISTPNTSEATRPAWAGRCCVGSGDYRMVSNPWAASSTLRNWWSNLPHSVLNGGPVLAVEITAMVSWFICQPLGIWGLGGWKEYIDIWSLDLEGNANVAVKWIRTPF
jgi:hypothetical protein